MDAMPSANPSKWRDGAVPLTHAFAVTSAQNSARQPNERLNTYTTVQINRQAAVNHQTKNRTLDMSAYAISA